MDKCPCCGYREPIIIGGTGPGFIPLPMPEIPNIFLSPERVTVDVEHVTPDDLARVVDILKPRTSGPIFEFKYRNMYDLESTFDWYPKEPLMDYNKCWRNNDHDAGCYTNDKSMRHKAKSRGKISKYNAKKRKANKARAIRLAVKNV